MRRLEFNTVVHNGIIKILKNTPEIKDKEVKVIIMWEDKLLPKKKKLNGVKANTHKLEKLYKIIDAGVDISSFGDVKEWQKTTRADRNLKLLAM